MASNINENTHDQGVNESRAIVSVELFENLWCDEFMGLILSQLGQARLCHLVQTAAVLFENSQEKLLPQDRHLLFDIFELQQVVGEHGKHLFGETVVLAHQGFQVV